MPAIFRDFEGQEMRESARLEEYKIMIGFECGDTRQKADQEDEVYANRIRELLNHPKIDNYCVVDACYYDAGEIPDEVCHKYGLYTDQYLIYGISFDGEFISKWVGRWDLNSDDPILNGEVVRSK